MTDSARESGLFSSLRRLLGTALEIAQVRLELLGTEVEIEKRRLLEGLLWGAIALICLSVGILLLCGFLILLFWEGYRLPAIGVMTLIFLGSSVLLAREARNRLRNVKTMFKASLAELDQDRAGLRTPRQL